MKRRDLLAIGAAEFAALTIPAATKADANEHSTLRSIPLRPPLFTTTIGTRQFRLSISLDPGLCCRLEDIRNGNILADGPYSYSFGDPALNVTRNERGTVVLTGETQDGIGVTHSFIVHEEAGWIEEQITLTNTGRTPLDLHLCRCGFILPIQRTNRNLDATTAAYRFVAVPFVREPNASSGRQRSEYTIEDILTKQFESGLWTNYSFVATPSVATHYAAEGWIWRLAEDDQFLVSKYSQNGMEWAILDHVRISRETVALRWGGIGFHLGNPECGARILPGQSHQFGTTRLTAVSSMRYEGFYAFREEMSARGHRFPPDFNPPVHWNELYDNKLFSLKNGGWDDPEMRKKYYSLASMKEEAAKASAIGCEALYLDPGWDTNLGSKIWDEARLGAFESFTSMLRYEYGLKCSLHTPLSGWSNPATYSSDTFLMDRFGERAKWIPTLDIGSFLHYSSPICGASGQYVAETVRRLKTLARDGAAYFMLDGTGYRSECWDTNHGHAVPARVEEHVAATMRVARLVHEDFPDLLIEMHDPVVGGFGRYAPIYYGHGNRVDGEGAREVAGFDSVWAFELMWAPLETLLNRQALALYYFNLAYSLPLYIHIDLRNDNENALAFWWNASTCRHLGIGGTPAEPAVANAHRDAMKTYKGLKAYFASGAFYGIDEMIHVHCRADGSSAVMNCFNLDDRPVEREVRLEECRFGLDTRRAHRFHGADFKKTKHGYRGTVVIPPRGHTLVEISEV